MVASVLMVSACTKPTATALSESGVSIKYDPGLMPRWPKRHARLRAARKADAMLEAGDLDGQAVWMQIIKALEELQGIESGDHPIH